MGEVFTVLLPDIGEGVVEGEVIEWLKAEGDRVEQDEPVVTVMTDKATVDLPAPYPGVVSKHYQQPGELAIKDKPIYDITVADGVRVKQTKKKAATSGAEQVRDPVKVPAAVAASGKVLATPATRGLARDLQMDIREVRGTGPDGRVTSDDIRSQLSMQSIKAAATSHSGKRAAPIIGTSTPVLDLPGDEYQPLIGQRNYIAEKMSEAKLIVPNFAYFDSMDCTRLIQLRKNLKEQALERGIKLTYMPFFIRALSLCLKRYPFFNGSLDMDERRLVIHKSQNIGLAVRTDAGVIVPVLKDVQDMNLEQVIMSYEELKNKAMADQLEAHDMRDATITISNFGAVGGKWATPIINYPEVCIIGIARIEPQALVRNRQIEVRDMLNLSWCCDHRVIDGHMAAEFSNMFIDLLEHPAKIL